MKKTLLTLILSITTLALAVTANAQDKHQLPQRTAFSNFGVSLNAGLTGAGFTVSSPLSKYFTLRAGFGTLPLSYNYNYANMPTVKDRSNNDVKLPQVKIKAKLTIPTGHMLVDYTPFKKGWGGFHLTAGLYFGGSKMLHAQGSIDLAELDRLNVDYRSVQESIYFDLGDARIRPADNGTIDAYAEINAVKPYFGLGWGNAIPKRRVGVRFDIGAMYQGKPKLTSPTMTGTLSGQENDDLNKVLKYAKFWPQIQLAITVRLLKHK
jgi:hypothetical protein